MKVGTDGVLLGALAPITNQTRHILDIGAGTGVISLMLAQRLTETQRYDHPRQQPEFSITAVEIDAEAAKQCQENFEASPWAGQLTAVAAPLQEFAQIEAMETVGFDLIVSNPPFYNATLKPDDEGRAKARHKDSLPICEITAFAQKHLAGQGLLALIYPSDYDTEVMTAALLHGLKAVRICDIRTKANKPCKRRVAVYARNTHSELLSRDELIIRDTEGCYTQQYRGLCESFYLRLN